MSSARPNALEPEHDLSGLGRGLLALRPYLQNVAGRPIDELVEAVEDATLPLERRHAAGLQLALVGDPRVEGQFPRMVDLPGGMAPIGLATDRVDAVVADWSTFGVRRDWILKETPRHIVTVAPFRLARYPVTNIEYLRYVETAPGAERPTAWAHGWFPLLAANHPVFSVSPVAADGYVAWLAATSGRPFRLPTESEWEYAATGGDGRQYPWGEAWDPRRANTAEAGLLAATPVGIYVEGQSPFGVSDLAGNVEEYVSDAYHPYPGATFIQDDLAALHGNVYRVTPAVEVSPGTAI